MKENVQLGRKRPSETCPMDPSGVVDVYEVTSGDPRKYLQ